MYLFVYLYEICFYTSTYLRYFYYYYYYWVLYYLNYLRDFDVSVVVPV